MTEAPVIELTGITVAPTKVNLELNATYQLSAVKEPVNAAGSLNWESSNTSVATVDSTGKVTAKHRARQLSQSPAAIRRLPAPLRSTTSMTTPVSRTCIWIPAITIRSARQATATTFRLMSSRLGRITETAHTAATAPSAR